jgi:hypothetical protein
MTSAFCNASFCSKNVIVIPKKYTSPPHPAMTRIYGIKALLEHSKTAVYAGSNHQHSFHYTRKYDAGSYSFFHISNTITPRPSDPYDTIVLISYKSDVRAGIYCKLPWIVVHHFDQHRYATYNVEDAIERHCLPREDYVYEACSKPTTVEVDRHGQVYLSTDTMIYLMRAGEKHHMLQSYDQVEMTTPHFYSRMPYSWIDCAKALQSEYHLVTDPPDAYAMQMNHSVYAGHALLLRSGRHSTEIQMQQLDDADYLKSIRALGIHYTIAELQTLYEFSKRFLIVKISKITGRAEVFPGSWEDVRALRNAK